MPANARSRLCIFLGFATCVVVFASAPSGPARGAEPEPASSVGSAPSPTDEIRAKLVEFTRLSSEIRALMQQMDGLEGEERVAVSFQTRERWMDAIRLAHKLAQGLVEAESSSLDTTELRPQVEAAMQSVTRGLGAVLDRNEERLAELRAQREKAEADGREVLDVEIGKLLDNRTTLDRQYLEHLGDLEALGLATDSAVTELSRRLRDRVEGLSGRVQLAAQQLAEARRREAATPGDAARAEATRQASDGLDRLAASLQSTLDTMESVGLDTARYRRVLIGSTGEISTAIFDREVATGLLEQWSEGALEWVRGHAATLLLRLLLVGLVLGLTAIAARITRRLVEHAVNGTTSRLNQLAREMLVNLSGRIVWILGTLVAVSQLGIEIGPLLAGLGVAGFIVGFALQDTLGNFASGAMILVYRPYDVGDLIEAAGVFGTVSRMSLVSTTILTIDNQTLVVPNSKIWGDVIKNVTAQRVRRVDMKFGISYADDVARAEQIFEAILKEHPKVLDDPPPMVRLHQLGDSSVDFIVRPWVATADYWDVYWDVTREVKLRLDREGITIPFPQRTVHMAREAATGATPDARAERRVAGATGQEPHAQVEEDDA